MIYIDKIELLFKLKFIRKTHLLTLMENLSSYKNVVDTFDDLHSTNFPA